MKIDCEELAFNHCNLQLRVHLSGFNNELGVFRNQRKNVSFQIFNFSSCERHQKEIFAGLNNSTILKL